jgi:hypothetical protein
LGKALFAKISRGRHGHDRMVAVFTTTCAISSYHVDEFLHAGNEQFDAIIIDGQV